MGRERTVLGSWLNLVVTVVVLLGSVDRAPAVDCDDGNKCTVSDTCRNGRCIGTPVQCADDRNPCTVEFCNPATGACATQPTDCNDNNPCTTDACNPSVGCTHTNLADATTCSDGSDCTTGDACVAGVCVGTPVTNGTTCGGTMMSDPCHAECQNGVCLTDANDAEPCSDGLTCTEHDACLSGRCVGQSTCVGINGCVIADCVLTGCAPIDKCPAMLSECVQTGACNETTGECISTPRNEGQSCDDGNSCTIADQCVVGLCQGTALGVAPDLPAAALSTPWLAGLAAALIAFATFRVQTRRARS